MAVWACPSCGGENPEGTRFCGHCGTPLDERTDDDAPGVSQTLRSFVAEPVADRLVESGGELPQERRLITALFADVSGFTALADRLDPEELLEVIDPVISGLSSIVGRYEGYVEKFAGDALLALFGAPVSHEDDAERALLTALEMHRELARMCEHLPYDAELTLHCGVNSGHGIARILGSEARMDYAVLGDSVILAQRLESAAPKGETYVSDLTYRLTAARFAFEPVGELTLKGKSEPVVAWRLLSESHTPRPVTRGGPAIVGRASELDALGEIVAATGTGTGGVVVLTGEPGVGKTRLTEAVREQAEANGVRWLQTRCLSYGAALAYWPYAELLRTLAGTHHVTNGEQARDALRGIVRVESALPFFMRLLELAAPTDDVTALEPEAFRRGLHDAFAAWITELASHEPVALVLEDAHWADASSLDLTRELVLACELQPVVICMTARPEARTALVELAPGARAIDLAPLEEGAIRELTELTLGGHAAAGLVSWVVERTTGNPFFVEELLRALGERDLLTAATGGWTLRAGWEAGELPPTVEGLLASRIDLLPRHAAEVLQTAAVIGRMIRVPLLAAVRQDDRVLETGVETLVERSFLDRVPNGAEPTVSFHHALVHDVAYARLLRRQRRDLHRRVAEVAEELYGAGDDVVELLARHLYLGEAGTKAFDYLVRAGERARRLYANEEAILHFTRAAEVAQREESLADMRAATLLSVADLHDLVGDYDEAIRLYADVRERTSELRAWCGLAAAHRKRGEYEQARAVIDEALQAKSIADDDLVQLWFERGTILNVEGRFDDAIESLRAGLDATGPRRDEMAGQLLVPLARAELMSGRLDEALTHGTEAQARFEAAGDLRGQSSAARLLGDVFTTLGRPDDAVETLAEGLELAERVGNVEEIGGCLINLGLAELARGEFAAAVACNERAIGEFERIGHGSGRALGYSNLAWVLANKGDYDEAERYCEKGIELASSIGHLLVAAETTDTMAFLELRRGLPAEAAAHAEEAARLFLDLGAAPKAAQSLELAGDAWSAAGDEERARETRSRARGLA